MKFEYVKSPARAEEIAKEFMSKPYMSLDTETTGLDSRTDKVTLLSIADSSKNTYVIDTRDVNSLKCFKDVFEKEDLKKVIFNNYFDYRMILGTAGIRVEGAYDLMIGEYCLTQGLQFAGRDLESVTKKYIGKERDKTLQTSFVGHKGDFTQDQLKYAAEDSADLIDIAAVMSKKIKDAGLSHIWKIESDCIPCFGDITHYGMTLNAESWKKILEDNERGAANAKKELDTFFSPVVDGLLFPEFGLDINYDSQPQLLAALQKLRIKVDGEIIQNTNKRTQKKIKDLPVIKVLEKYRSFQKGVGTYGRPYLDALHPITGRLHPSLNSYGAESGRPTAKKPSVLNIPREARYRESFEAAPGKKLGTIDYSAAELRILAELSSDPVMIAGFKSGIDYHCYVASKLFKCEVTKKNENSHLRQPTKAINFGIAYGMSPPTLFERLMGEGYKTTLEETEKMYNDYCEEFKVAIGYLRGNGAVARKELKLQSATGRLRHWREPNTKSAIIALKKEFKDEFDPKTPEGRKMIDWKIRGQWSAIEREGGNFAIQEMNATFSKRAMADMRREFIKRGWMDNVENPAARIYNFVYDEVVTEVDDSIAEEAFSIQKKCMIDAAHYYLKKVPMEVEGHLDTKWTK